MRATFRILSGARAGHQDQFDKPYVGLGRHPLSDVRFDAERDLDVSARHAAVLRPDGHYLVRDLGSRNGTFVNGRPVEGDCELVSGDVIRLGANGPEVEFNLAAVSAVSAVPETAVGAAPPTRAGGRPEARPAAGPSSTSVLRAEIRTQRSLARAVALAAVIVLVGALAVVWWQGRSAVKDRVASRTALDSLGRQVSGLASALEAARSETEGLRRELAASSGDTRRQGQLRQRLAVAEARQRSIVAAQAVDYRAIATRNQAAVAVVYAQFADTTQMWSGTGFAVTTDGMMITNRHIVVNDAGERAARLAVQFADSREVLRGRLVRTSPNADLAVIRVESSRPVPAVLGLESDASAVQAGDPVALIGYPLGLDLPMEGGSGGTIPKTSLTQGLVSKVIGDSLLQLDAFSGTGASGSPVFDRNGRVIGVEFGGLSGSGGRVVFALPIRRAMALLGSGPQ